MKPNEINPANYDCLVDALDDMKKNLEENGNDKKDVAIFYHGAITGISIASGFIRQAASNSNPAESIQRQLRLLEEMTRIARINNDTYLKEHAKRH